MKEKFKKLGSLSVDQELSRNEQKKIMGGVSGHKCANSSMNCTTSPIDSGYCRAVWPASNGVVVNC